MTTAGAILILIGSAFSLLAAIGVIRFPDVYTRLHAASKACPLGAGLILLGAGASFAEPFTMLRCLIGLVFLILVSPISAHLLARAALRSSTPPASITSINEFRDSP